MEGYGHLTHLLKLLLPPTPWVIGFFNPCLLYTNPSIVTYQKFSTYIQSYEIDFIDYWIFMFVLFWYEYYITCSCFSTQCWALVCIHGSLSSPPNHFGFINLSALFSLWLNESWFSKYKYIYVIYILVRSLEMDWGSVFVNSYALFRTRRKNKQSWHCS